MIAIIDYQAGNQTSVQRALTHLNIKSEITADPAVMQRAAGVIFPGVGAAGQAMNHLTATGLDRVIKDLAGRRPLLGVCVGCQIMLEESEEDGHIKTLGLIPGQCFKFGRQQVDEAGERIRIPHMGWNNVAWQGQSPLFEGLTDTDQFYFVHSFYPQPPENLALGMTSYGLSFPSVFGRDGLWAVQFHPEKSGRAGLRLLNNFARYCEEVG